MVHEGDPSNIGMVSQCGATMVSARRFLDQQSLGTPHSLDSEILIDVVEAESTDEQITQQAVRDEELDDAGMRSVEEQAARIDIENFEVEPEEVDQYGEQGDYSNEHLTLSSNKATNPPALCLNTEEVAKVFDEVLACPTKGPPC